MSEDAKERALRAVLLWFGSSWTTAAQAEWLRLTGRTSATTRDLCDAVREALGEPRA